MSREAIKQLRHRDAGQRKLAIKLVARAKERAALKQLAIMSGDDPDPEVRNLARKAGVYIRQQLGELPSEPIADESEPTKSKPAKAPASKQNAEAAQKLLSAAMTYQLNGEQGRTIKTLEKALALDPNLRTDAYFVSLCESATGIEGAEAVAALGDEGKYTDIVQTETQQKKQKGIDIHLGEVTQVTWPSALFDLGVFFVIMTVGVMLATFVLLQSAGAFMERFEEAEEVATTQEFDAEGNLILPLGVEERFLEFSRSTSELGITQVFMNGLIAGFASAISMLLFIAVVHFAASHLLRGIGSLPYLLHKWASLWNIRTVVIFFLLYVGIVVTFSSNGGAVIFIFAGLIGLVVLFSLLKALGIVAKAYNFSFVKALAAVLVAGFLISIINSVLLGVATGIITV